jgi:hypothetical protein
MFEIYMAKMVTTVFWVVTLCGFVGGYRCFEGMLVIPGNARTHGIVIVFVEW